MDTSICRKAAGVVLLAVVLLVSGAHGLKTCTVENDCAGTGYPICALVNANTNAMACVQCRPCPVGLVGNATFCPGQMCDCGIGQYCSSDPTNPGVCMGMSSGGSCAAGFMSAAGQATLQYGVNDKQFCGLAHYGTSPSQGQAPLAVSWAGPCIGGSCQICQETYANTYNGYERTPDCNTGQAVARVCLQGAYIEVSRELWNPTIFGENPDFVWNVMIWLFVALFWVVMTINVFKNKIGCLKPRVL
eukprot:gnl/Hemi2/27858_TR9198_c0_g1_i1.p1 gnl/Hemi2/27858_TR9198_c0_g1~~gnl/Hemi2/27858_TR9198_c0_g1_i1.p1  ORF type:complete len:246 (+),score=66.91 gnl/Hemi2/27858_TR9198_c0_g1_i1:136-873(+)